MSLKQKISYSQFKQAKVKWSSLGGDVEDVKSEKKPTKPKSISQLNIAWIEKYWLVRDRVIFKIADEKTKQEILERYKVTV